MTKKVVSIGIEENLLKKIDRERGLIKRSTYIEQILREALK